MRRGYNTWTRSLSPHDFSNKVSHGARVIALTGEHDDNTRSVLAHDFVSNLTARGINTTYIEVPKASHNSILRTDAFRSAVKSAISP